MIGRTKKTILSLYQVGVASKHAQNEHEKHYLNSNNSFHQLIAGAHDVLISNKYKQQSVASAILATTQQSVRNTTTLIVTATFRSSSTFRLWG